MPQAYKQQITKTFRDDAIRSVLLIDDDYHPYTDLAQKQQELIEEIQKIAPKLPEGELPPAIPQDAKDVKLMLSEVYAKIELLRESAKSIADSFKRTSVAAEFGRFFHNAKCICDVEKQTAQLNPEKVRKSDLIILDYCLNRDDPSASLQLLRELSSSKHLNLVVIYTNKSLSEVWLEIAATLRGPKTLTPQEYFSDDPISLSLWDDASDEYQEFWSTLSRPEEVSFILDGPAHPITDELRVRFWSDIQAREEFDQDIHKEPTTAIVNYLCELDISEKNLLTAGREKSHIHGKDNIWIQCGEVFIALCEKKDSSSEEIVTQPQAVWDKLEEALHSWYPSFYRVVLSELQNRIEDSNFSMSKIVGKPEHEQIALLWSILKEDPNRQLIISESLLHHLLQDISDELLHRDNKAVPNLIKSVANSTVENPPVFIPFKKSNSQPHNEFVQKALEVSKSNFKTNQEKFDQNFHMSVAHAHNKLLSTKRSLPEYITTGTILKSSEGKQTNWYVCVTPSCDTVPNQETDEVARWLSPHRLLSFIKLTREELCDALSVATQSSHVFITDIDGERVALRVINQITKQPDLVQLIVKNHKTTYLTTAGITATSITSIQKKKGKGNLQENNLTLIPVAQLKSAYAARFQAIKSHHEGRVGVDYIPAFFSEMNPAEPPVLDI
ncbi:response regulator receiver domain [Shewanella sp. HL-SH2]|uniref:response regulator receiver domain n=1 Tax=Shewanella sp. HL-SH2 TaxID=3436238 RepID=UPI003EB89EE4